VLAERVVANPPAAAESSRRCHQLQQQVDAAATVIAALYANNTALREQFAARTAPVRNVERTSACGNAFTGGHDQNVHPRVWLPSSALAATRTARRLLDQYQRRSPPSPMPEPVADFESA
jgi:hypothetical protein